MSDDGGGPRRDPAGGHREAFFRKVLEDSADITSVLSATGERVFVSSGVTAVLGYTEAEALGLRVGESTHPDDQAYVQATFRGLLAEPRGRARLRFRQRHKNGTWRTVDALARNELDDPDIGGIVVTTRDVTEQVQLEAQFLQAQKLESVGRLAGGVAHDFNNLLVVILSGLEHVEEASAKGQPSPADVVDEVRAAAERARDLTRQLLAFARRDTVKAHPLDLNAVLTAAGRMLPRLLGEDIELRQELAPDLWPIRSDAGQIDQILFNLAVNARDAMPNGGRFTIRTSNHAGPPDEVGLVVTDTGVGMAPDVRARVFEPFFTTKELGKGTGLGLATVHGIVTQHGGRIEVHSTPGGGARFEIRFPRCPDAAEAAIAPPVAPATVGDGVVLLVEDEPLVREIEARALRSAGYRVVLAGDGAEALERLRAWTGSLDLLVTDVVMPRMDGVALHVAARALRPALPVLFVSGYADERISPEALQGSAVDFLPKPFTPAALVARARALLGH